MMNRHEMAGRPGGEAKVRFLDADFQVTSPGTFVRCAVTGKPIPLAELRYWDVDTQEAYIDANAAYEAFKAHQAKG
ncbi:DUF2093 domain-containing protein [Acuticoccus sp. M5D2P5]|uniref:DUF2093 domain-containing protein n=1 Tax=Acuticoccus kalidii TaxID=2910977 RepID=UPI001F37AF56|nr:DUF2093 domain-containing protein [Acuticoccus kalidii]MCF3933512.1 DUF2093 domain-containing protein [Acuticoccus kalidii]